jgi:hypothetical protein
LTVDLTKANFGLDTEVYNKTCAGFTYHVVVAVFGWQHAEINWPASGLCVVNWDVTDERSDPQPCLLNPSFKIRLATEN